MNVRLVRLSGEKLLEANVNPDAGENGIFH